MSHMEVLPMEQCSPMFREPSLFSGPLWLYRIFKDKLVNADRKMTPKSFLEVGQSVEHLKISLHRSFFHI